jgi:hypothetical protein
MLTYLISFPKHYTTYEYQSSTARTSQTTKMPPTIIFIRHAQAVHNVDSKPVNPPPFPPSPTDINT